MQTFYQKIYQDKQWVTLSNLLSILRMLLAPVFVIGVYHLQFYFSFVVLMVASLSDLFDGLLARWLKQETVLGAALDPLADKLFLLSMFYSLVWFGSPSFQIPAWFLWLLLVREVIILIGSGVVLKINTHATVSPSMWGKFTTVFQLLFVMWLFSCYFFGWEPTKSYYFFLISLALFSFLSLLLYINEGIRYLIGIKKN